MTGQTLSIHVLDTAHGIPARGMAVALCGRNGIIRGITNADGRCPQLVPKPIPSGNYWLEFGVADYFRSHGVELPDPPFLDLVSIHFGMAADGSHYHVPLLVSPYSYSTYRGS